MLRVDDTISIPEAELVERFVRATGPGGQNVNKVSSAVELRFDVARSRALPDELRNRLLARRDRRLSRAGVLVIEAARHRDQGRNREDARARLAGWIKAAMVPAKPRVATRPSRAERERRIERKKARGTVKRTRGKVSWTDG